MPTRRRNLRPTTARCIVLVSNGLALGGSEAQTVFLAESLAHAGREVAVLAILPSALGPDGEPVHEARLRAAGVPLHIVGGSHPRALPTLLAARRRLRELRPDVLVSF